MENNVPYALSYSECVELAQAQLKELSKTHGRLKKWCEENDLYYKTIVKLKNGSLTYYAPQLILKILTLSDYTATITRRILTNHREEDIFIVEKRSEATSH